MPQRHNIWTCYGRLPPAQKYSKRIRLTGRGDIIDYPGYVSTPTSDTNTVKILWNGVVSTTKAKYMFVGINILYLGMPLTRYKYLRKAITLVLDEIIQHYTLLPLVRNGFIYVDNFKGMY